MTTLVCPLAVLGGLALATRRDVGMRRLDDSPPTREAPMTVEHATGRCTGLWSFERWAGVQVIVCRRCGKVVRPPDDVVEASRIFRDATDENDAAYRWADAEKSAWRRGYMRPGHRFGPCAELERVRARREGAA